MISMSTGIMANASPADETTESFGCHLSWPELRPNVADRHTLSREERILAKEKWDFNDRPTYYTAIRNLQGFIAYHLNKHDQALEFFRDVLDRDENNINALGNIAFIHGVLGEIQKHRDYQGKLSKILEKSSNAEIAKAYADKAHAIRYFEQSKRCFRYMRFIERAVKFGEKCDGTQKAEWFFDYALALYRRDVQMLYLRTLANQDPSVSGQSECYSDERIKERFLEACWYFREVARTTTSKDYRALSWVFLGILVNHDPEHRSLSMAFPEEPQFQLTAEECYQRGLKIHPTHEIVLRRVGSEYVKLERFVEAGRFLDESLRIRESQFGYRHRALMFLALCETAKGKDTGTQRVKQWLSWKAVDDFTKALSMKEFHSDYSDLGYVYHLLGDPDKALVNFLQAMKSEQDDYFDPVLTCQRWSTCLESKGELEGSQKKKEEAERIREKILNSPLGEDESDNLRDFEHYNTKEKTGYVRIVKSNFFAVSCAKCYPVNHGLSTRKYPYDFFVWHAERDNMWAEAFVLKLESEHGRKGCKRSRDFEPGIFNTRNISNCLKQSYTFVVILTSDPPETKSDGYMRFAINLAVNEGCDRVRGGEYIVPIQLQDCSTPTELQAVTVLKCVEGQIRKENWDHLVHRLTQQT